ncbi:MAG: hypothetical protein CL529_11990 [Aequorivita sp.]|nr:hypothetical protein [Aequorivita sp.]|tara:strand:+ start:30956 stop:31363 length:408 start_codon:yes stop_codon:yes gene_type:complete
MERDENGRVLSKTGQCPVCRKRLRVLADEDFDCCEVREQVYDEFEGVVPNRKLVNLENQGEIKFSVKDMILAMMGQDWVNIKNLHHNLEAIGFDSVMVISREHLISLLEDLETDETIEAHWDMENFKRIELEEIY